jgi:solute:Na+ symporter, SSS family
MTILGLPLVDFIVLLVYFAAILYIGVFLGASKTKNLGDFFVAGGKWGPLVSFIFVFASAIAGNEAVVVSGKAYHSGLSGVWLWWSFLFATPVYFLFSTYYRRARVYNLAEFLEMRFGRHVAALYALVAGIICILFIGMFLLAIAKLLAGFTGMDEQIWVWAIAVVVGAYVCAGGMMSALLTDLLQGVMCLIVLGCVMLPFVWNAAGGWQALRDLPPTTWQFVEHWDFTSPGMNIGYILALNISALAGGIAAPWIYNWIAISRDEKTATQCAWGHLWKRIFTLVFALYGIFFAMLYMGLEGKESETAWGLVMRQVLPTGWGLAGLMIAGFFAAAMSSTDTYATTSSAMFTDFIYRRVLAPNRSTAHYLLSARVWSVVSVALAAVSTLGIEKIQDYVNLAMAMLAFLGIPIYFGVVWRKASKLGMWISLLLAISSFVLLKFVLLIEANGYGMDAMEVVTQWTVFVPTSLALFGMWFGSWLQPDLDKIKLDRFYTIMNTPIGQEQRLVDAGIQLPALIDAGLQTAGPEQLRHDRLQQLVTADAQEKFLGPGSSIELRRERLDWYGQGFLRVTTACVLLVVGTWLLVQILFVWTR